MSSEALVAPTDLRDYFKAQGWVVLEKAIADRLYVLSNPAYESRQIIFPMDLSAPDYQESVEIAVSKLAELTGKTVSRVFARMQSVKDDVVRLRVFFDGNDNVLPLSFASVLVQSTEKLLKAAACTVLRPRVHHPRLALNEANQFVNQARFGQTERGSFVLNVACPLHAMEAQGTLEFDTPFVRQVTLSLYQALSQLTTAIEADTVTRLVDELKRSEKPLLSSNLCEALCEMHDDQVNNSLDLGFDWSALRAVPQRINSRPILIQRDYFSRVEEVRRELRSLESAQDEVFIGTVEKLEGEMGQDGRRSGGVVLALLLPEEGETVRARTILLADDYHKADIAHMTNGAYVRVAGRLMPGRQPRLLTDIRSFEVIPNA
jgi:hypothetical protein